MLLLVEVLQPMLPEIDESESIRRQAMGGRRNQHLASMRG